MTIEFDDEGAFCAESSERIGEPLAGTAVRETDCWLMIELADAWTRLGWEEAAFPPPVSELLARLDAAHARLRIQLVRRPDRGPERAPRCFLSYTGGDAPWLSEVKLETHADLVAVDLAGWLSDPERVRPGTPVDAPLVLVCVHSRRDRCCALRGMRVYRALADTEPEWVWQTSHLGGHRFAATLVGFPYGYAYGRVTPAEVPALLAAEAEHRLFDLARVRGRTCWPTAVQAADVHVRAAEGLVGMEALAFEGCEPDGAGGDGVLVGFRRGDGSRVSRRVTSRDLPPFVQSCGKAPAEARAHEVA